MGTLLTTWVVMMAASNPAGPCFVPADPSPGWKLVVLPENAPALAAPEGVDQFRPHEPARVLQSDSSLYSGSRESLPGRLELDFALPPDSRRLELEFLEPLQGAKVDATLYAGNRVLPLVRDKRLAGEALELEWDVPDVTSLEVSVHYHLRGKPALRRWRVVRQAVLASDASVPPAFKLGRALYYRQPADRRVELCQAPERKLELDRGHLAPDAVPMPVNLAPK